MRTTQTKKIEDDYGQPHEYECTQHGAEQGFELMRQVLRIVGEAVAEGFETKPQPGVEVMEQQVTGAMLGGAVAVLMREIDLTLIKRLLLHTTRTNDDGMREKVAQNFDRIYQGNYGELGLALWFVLEHNFGPTLRGRLEKEGITARLASLMPQVA